MVVSGEKRREIYFFCTITKKPVTIHYCFTYRSRQLALVKQRVKGLDRIQGEKKFGEIGKGKCVLRNQSRAHRICTIVKCPGQFSGGRMMKLRQIYEGFVF